MALSPAFFTVEPYNVVLLMTMQSDLQSTYRPKEPDYIIFSSIEVAVMLSNLFLVPGMWYQVSANTNRDLKQTTIVFCCF
jgi:hypothetical protein